MKKVDQTKDEWMKQQQSSVVLAAIFVSGFLMGLVGLFAFGVGCIFLNFLQAFGCGIVASTLTLILSAKRVGRQMRRELEKQADNLQFRVDGGPTE